MESTRFSRGNRRLGSVQHTPKHHTRVLFSSEDRQSNFPKNSCLVYQLSSMRSERENETIKKAGGRGSRRAERQRQNPKRETDATGALTAAGTCEGAKAAAEVAQRAATASFMVKLFWVISIKSGSRSREDQQAREANGGSRAVHIRHHVDWLQERWSCSYKMYHGRK